MSYRSRTAFYFSSVAALLLAACSGQTALERQTEAALADYHTTCLKRRLPIDTPEHSACVTALYQERQDQLARLRTVVAPAALSAATDVDVSLDGVTNKGSAPPTGGAPRAKPYEVDDALLRGY